MNEFKPCEILGGHAEIAQATQFLRERGFVTQPYCEPKNWDLAHVLPRLGPGNVLDMGCQASLIFEHMIRSGFNGDMVGVDLTPVKLSPGVRFLQVDLTATGLPAEHFDHITCLSVIEHGVPPYAFVDEAYRLLKPGGHLYVTFDYWNPKAVGLPDWNIYDRVDAERLIAYARIKGLQLIDEPDWTQRDAPIGPGYFSPNHTSYTFGCLIFRKESRDRQPYFADKETDRTLRECFFPHAYPKGVFVDVGGGDPITLSNSHHFRLSGWQVVAVEPLPHLCERYRALGFPVLEYAAGTKEGDVVDFTRFDVMDGMSGSSLVPPGGGTVYPDVGNSRSIIKVNVRRLDTLLAQYYPEVTKIDILSVDAEGWELDVIDSLDLEKYKPSVVVLECIFKHQEYIHKMASLGYTFWGIADIENNFVFLRGGKLP